MKRRCVSCRSTLAADNRDSQCSPCIRAYDEAVMALARWLERFMRSDLSAGEYAEALVSSISIAGTAGYEARDRLLRAVVDSDHLRDRRSGSRPLAPLSATRPAPRSRRPGGDPGLGG